jgi:hypothetical protein
MVVAAAHGRSDAPDTLNPKYPPRTEHRPAIAVLDVFIVLLVAKSSEPDFVNQLTPEVRSRTGVNMTTFQGHVLLTWAGDDQHPGGLRPAAPMTASQATSGPSQR